MTDSISLREGLERYYARNAGLFGDRDHSAQAQAFCGFYVAKADASLFNEASKVVIARHEDRTVMTMANDFKGDVDDFAIVIPVPTVIKESQVNIGDSKIIDHLDAYTAPRLVEYYDANPCAPVYKMEMMRSAMPMAAMMDSADQRLDAAALGVKFEPVEVTWGTAIAALQGNKIDIMYMMDATPERAQAVDFPESPLLYYSLAVLARDDLPVKAWADLNKAGVRIAVPQASSMDRFLSENTPNATIQRFPGNGEAIAAFQAGRADAVCLFHPPLLAARQKLGSGKIVVPTPARSQASSAAVRKEDKAFLAFVDKQLAEYYKGGQTQKWYEEFLTGFGLDPKASPPVMKEML